MSVLTLVCTAGLALETGTRYKRKYPHEPAEAVRGHCSESRMAEANSGCSGQHQLAGLLKVCDREAVVPLCPSLVESAPPPRAFMPSYSIDFSATSFIPS